MQQYKVGFGRVDITPAFPVPLGGFGNTSKRFWKSIRDHLMASCFAITDEEGSTLLLCTCDLSVMPGEVTKEVRRHISASYGVPEDHIMIATSHTHAGPDMHSSEPSLREYVKTLVLRLEAVCALALADRMPAQISFGDVETEGMNFVKHYIAKPVDGEPFFYGDNFNDTNMSPDLVQKHSVHATDADPTLHVVKITRENGKDLVIGNFRGHPLFVGGRIRYELSADAVGEYRKAFEEKYDAYFTFFQGAAGNINMKSRILAEMQTTDCTAYGQHMADYTLEALKDMKPLAYAPIKTKQFLLPGKVNHTTDCLRDAALEVRKVWMETYDPIAARKMGAPYGIRSPYHANAILGRIELPETLPLELNAITLGELAFVTAPNELFDTISVFVEDNAPYAKVLTVGYANDYCGYIPSKFGYEYTCYESDCTRYQSGIGEDIAENLVRMLKELKQ